MSIDPYLRSLSLAPKSILPILHEETLGSATYKLILPDETAAILKISQDANRHRRELYFLTHLPPAIPVPSVLGHVEPADDLHGAILMEFLPGEPLTLRTLTDDLARQMGEILAHLHSVRAQKYGDLSLPHEKSTDPLQEMRRYYQDSRSECQNALPIDLLRSCDEYFEKNCPDAQNLTGPCLVHRDYKPGNIMAERGRVEGVIDWENSRGSFAEEDFAQMEQLVWSENAQSKKPFLSGYAAVRPLPSFEAILPFLRFCKILGAMGALIRRGTWQTAHRAIFERNLHYLQKLFAR